MSADRPINLDRREAGLPLFVPVVVIDETVPGNLLSDPSRGIPFSSEVNLSDHGFAHSDVLHRELARFILARFDLASRGPFLDVGFGQNLVPSTVMAESGVEACAIDVRQHPVWRKLMDGGQMGYKIERFWCRPNFLEESNGVRIFYGDIMKAARRRSALAGQEFGAILFNGSWSAGGGINFTIDYDRDGHANDYDYREKGKRLTLEACKSILAVPGGMIGIVSSRYAYHGAGYPFVALPLERQEFFWLYRQFSELGASKIHIVGMSKEAFGAAVERSLTGIDPNRIATLGAIRKTTEDVLSAEFLSPSDFTGVEPGALDVVNRIARIDAMFAEF